LDITTEEKQGKIVIHVSGRLDASSAPILEEKMSEVIGGGNFHLLIDFSNVEYLASAGMRLMLSNSKKLKTENGSLLFCSISEDVMEIIKMAGFEKILSIYPTEQEALAAS